jgi:hypothetical protein
MVGLLAGECSLLPRDPALFLVAETFFLRPFKGA